MAIDGKLHACDLVQLKVRDIARGDRVASRRAMVMPQKTQQPVQFEITEQTRDTVSAWISKDQLKSNDYLFPSRIKQSSAENAAKRYQGHC